MERCVRDERERAASQLEEALRRAKLEHEKICAEIRERAESEIATCRDRSAETSAAQMQAIRDLNDKKEELLRNHEKELNRLRKESEDAIQAHVRRSDREREQMLNTLRDLKEDSKHLGSKASVLLDDARQRHNGEIESIRDELRKFRTRNVKLETEISSCKSDLETSRAECELLSGRSERMEKEFEIEMEKMRDELKELRSSHEKELASLLKRHEMEMSSLLKRREVEIKTHDEEICKAREKYVKLQEKFELEIQTHSGEISKMSDMLEEMKRSFQTERKKLIETHNKEMFKVTEEHDELVVRLNKSFDVEKEELEEMYV